MDSGHLSEFRGVFVPPIAQDEPASFWSLGLFADLVWRYSPGARELVRDEVHRELDTAISQGRMPLEPNPAVVLTDLYYLQTLKPLLTEAVLDAPVVHVELNLIQQSIEFAGSEREWVHEYLSEYVLEPLIRDGLLEVITKVAPTITDMVDAFYSEHPEWRPAYPA